MRLLVCLLSFLALASFLHDARATDFRIETRVYAAEEEEPASKSVTLFSNGVAYDFRDTDHRVTIFRPGVASKPGRFVLLDTQRKFRTEIGADQVAIATTKLRRWASLQKDPFLKFTGDPVFKESFDSATGELLMESDLMSYRLTTMPVADKQTMSELRAFLDAFAQLHTLLEAGLPPAPRLLVNEALDKRNVVPVKVELFSGPIEEEPSLRAEHQITWILSTQDRDRIDMATNQLSEFKEVENSRFSSRVDQDSQEALEVSEEE